MAIRGASEVLHIWCLLTHFPIGGLPGNQSKVHNLYFEITLSSQLWLSVNAWQTENRRTIDLLLPQGRFNTMGSIGLQNHCRECKQAIQAVLQFANIAWP
jgi:hypothetical protein